VASKKKDSIVFQAPYSAGIWKIGAQLQNGSARAAGLGTGSCGVSNQDEGAPEEAHQDADRRMYLMCLAEQRAQEVQHDAFAPHAGDGIVAQSHVAAVLLDLKYGFPRALPRKPQEVCRSASSIRFHSGREVVGKAMLALHMPLRIWQRKLVQSSPHVGLLELMSAGSSFTRGTRCIVPRLLYPTSHRGPAEALWGCLSCSKAETEQLPSYVGG